MSFIKEQSKTYMESGPRKPYAKRLWTVNIEEVKGKQVQMLRFYRNNRVVHEESITTKQYNPDRFSVRAAGFNPSKESNHKRYSRYIGEY